MEGRQVGRMVYAAVDEGASLRLQAVVDVFVKARKGGGERRNERHLVVFENDIFHVSCHGKFRL